MIKFAFFTILLTAINSQILNDSKGNGLSDHTSTSNVENSESGLKGLISGIPLGGGEAVAPIGEQAVPFGGKGVNSHNFAGLAGINPTGDGASIVSLPIFSGNSFPQYDDDDDNNGYYDLYYEIYGVYPY